MPPLMMGGGRRRRRVQVRGCGCCLPVPLGLLILTSVGMRAVYGRVRR